MSRDFQLVFEGAIVAVEKERDVEMKRQRQRARRRKKRRGNGRRKGRQSRKIKRPCQLRHNDSCVRTVENAAANREGERSANFASLNARENYTECVKSRQSAQTTENYENITSW